MKATALLLVARITPAMVAMNPMKMEAMLIPADSTVGERSVNKDLTVGTK